MKFYTDGSRIGFHSGNSIIGWGAVCEHGVLCTGSQFGGSNINAEIFAIRDLLIYLNRYLNNKRIKNVNNDFKNMDVIDIETDSLTSIQIINGYMKDPEAYDLTKSANYITADSIVKTIKKLESIGKEVKFTHVKGHDKNIGNNFADYVATQESMKLLMSRKS